MTDLATSELIALLTSFITGGLVGLLFFWSLWLTVSGLNRARHPALRLLGSLLLRLCLVLGVFYFLADYAGWQHAALAAVGFTLSRLFLVHRVQHEQLQ